EDGRRGGRSGGGGVGAHPGGAEEGGQENSESCEEGGGLCGEDRHGGVSLRGNQARAACKGTRLAVGQNQGLDEDGSGQRRRKTKYCTPSHGPCL
ncbi:unnamed protein product, partial [Ectocarpus sp. 4 AP-2014]